MPEKKYRHKRWTRRQQFAVIARYYEAGTCSSDNVARKVHCSKEFVESCWRHLALKEAADASTEATQEDQTE